MNNLNIVDETLNLLHWECIFNNIDFEKENALISQLEKKRDVLEEKIKKEGKEETVKYFINYLNSHILKK